MRNIPPITISDKPGMLNLIPPFLLNNISYYIRELSLNTLTHYPNNFVVKSLKIPYFFQKLIRIHNYAHSDHH